MLCSHDTSGTSCACYRLPSDKSKQHTTFRYLLLFGSNATKYFFDVAKCKFSTYKNVYLNRIWQSKFAPITGQITVTGSGTNKERFGQPTALNNAKTMPSKPMHTLAVMKKFSGNIVQPYA